MKIDLHYYHHQYPAQKEGCLVISTCVYDWDKNFMHLQTLEIDVPDCRVLSQREAVPRMVEVLKEKAQTIKSNAFVELAGVDEQIQKLLCIENTTTEEQPDDLPF